MKSFFSLIVIIALFSSISCTCSNVSYAINADLAVGIVSGAFNTAGSVVNSVNNFFAYLKCNWLGFDCPKCTAYNPMTNVVQNYLNGSWFTVASRNMLSDDQTSCRREFFKITDSTLDWTTTYAFNNDTVVSTNMGNGAFVNGILSLSNNKVVRVLTTDYNRYLVLGICEPNRGYYEQDQITLLTRTNETKFVDLEVIAKVFGNVVFKNLQRPLTIPFVGRCACSTLPPIS